MKKPLSVFFLTSEVLPVVKTGGLADVSAALPAALSEEFGDEIDIRIGTVGFKGVERLPGFRLLKTFIARTPAGAMTIRILEGRLSKGNVPVYAVDPEGMFNREELYGENGTEYPDNLERFSAWNHALLHLPAVVGFFPDILHANDWQTALSIPLLPHVIRPSLAVTPMKTLLSIHNLAFQGVYPLDQWHLTGLPSSYNRFDGLEYHGRLSLLKGGIQFADCITTVSPSYREEVLSEPGGFGLSGALRHRRESFYGLLNGIDAHEWNPETDQYLPIQFSRAKIGKKSALQKKLRQEWGLNSRAPKPLFGVVSRMTHQKGAGLLAEAIYSMGLEDDLREDWVILGSGDPSLEDLWERIQRIFPGRIRVKTGYDEPLAHRIIAASDFLVIPSVYEPCGLTQMYAMRYGTIPLVNPTGGLRDTVESEKTGFWFEELTIAGIKKGLKKARALYHDQEGFDSMRQRAMAVESSWKNRTREYENLYRTLLSSPHGTNTVP